jgi:hypothetical protein
MLTALLDQPMEGRSAAVPRYTGKNAANYCSNLLQLPNPQQQTGDPQTLSLRPI